MALHSGIYCTLRNAGSGATYVTHLRYEWPGALHDNVVGINKALQPGEYLTMASGNETEYEVVNGIAPGDAIGVHLSHIPEDCLRRSYLHKDDMALMIFRSDLRGQLRTSPAKGYVYFYGRNGSRIVSEFPLEVVLERKSERRCREPFTVASPSP